MFKKVDLDTNFLKISVFLNFFQFGVGIFRFHGNNEV